MSLYGGYFSKTYTLKIRRNNDSHKTSFVIYQFDSRVFIEFTFNRNVIDHTYRLQTPIHSKTINWKYNRTISIEQKCNRITSIEQKCNGINDVENYLIALEQKLNIETSITLVLHRNGIGNHCIVNPNSYSIYIAIYSISIAQKQIYSISITQKQIYSKTSEQKQNRFKIFYFY